MFLITSLIDYRKPQFNLMHRKFLWLFAECTGTFESSCMVYMRIVDNKCDELTRGARAAPSSRIFACNSGTEKEIILTHKWKVSENWQSTKMYRVFFLRGLSGHISHWHSTARFVNKARSASRCYLC